MLLRVVCLRSKPLYPPWGGCDYMPESKDDKIDRSLLAVRRQLGGMRCRQYEVGIRDSKTGEMMLQSYGSEQLVKSVKFLKFKNLNGSDIYVRPKGSQGLVLVDDLSSRTIERMRSQGDAPAAIVETSPDNYQVWVRVSERGIASDVATRVAQGLAKRYGGDLNSADHRHFGRLAGFTNRKPMHVDENGRYPFVISHQSIGRTCANGERWVAWGQRSVLARSQKVGSAGSSSGVGDSDVSRQGQVQPESFYRSGLKFCYEKYGNNLDASRVDWAVAKKMAMYGYSSKLIQSVIKSESPGLDERKKGNVDDYLERTVGKVMKLPEVISARQRLALIRQNQIVEHKQPVPQQEVHKIKLRR